MPDEQEWEDATAEPLFSREEALEALMRAGDNPAEREEIAEAREEIANTPPELLSPDLARQAAADATLKANFDKAVQRRLDTIKGFEAALAQAQKEGAETAATNKAWADAMAKRNSVRIGQLAKPTGVNEYGPAPIEGDPDLAARLKVARKQLAAEIEQLEANG